MDTVVSLQSRGASKKYIVKGKLHFLVPYVSSVRVCKLRSVIRINIL